MTWHEFESRWDGLRHALSGGLWLHRHVLREEPMAHLVSSDRELLFHAGAVLGMPTELLQYRPLRHPDSRSVHEAWHWDLLRGRLRTAIRLAGPRIPLQRGRAQA